MKSHILITFWLSVNIQAYSPATLQWIEFSYRDMILAPKGFPSKVSVPPQEVTLLNHHEKEMTSSMLPRFMLNLDGTISWNGWCLDGDEYGHVQINYCTGGPAQTWNVVPSGQGRKKIQLHTSGLCLAVADDHVSSGSLPAAPIQLRSCENVRAGSWAFDEVGSPPSRSPSQLFVSPSMMRHAMIWLIPLACLGLLISSAWLWQHKKARMIVSQESTLLDVNQGGVSLSVPSSAHHKLQVVLPAVMSISPVPEVDAEMGDPRQRTNGDVVSDGKNRDTADGKIQSNHSEELRGSDNADRPDDVLGSTNDHVLNRFRPTPDPVLADPISKSPVQRKLVMAGSDTQEILFSDAGIQYPSKSAGANAMYFDLLPKKPITFTELGTQIADELFNVFSVQTGLFRSPVTAFLYERGWRQNFENYGYPGIENEFAEVQEYFSPAQGGNVVDLSCGSGLMSRRLVGSGSYARVLALDFSEEMLKETSRRFREGSISTDSLTLVRADAAALPLRLSSIDAIHAGAAMHCWPRLEQSLLEVRLSLKSGGRFFATTFFQSALGPRMPMARPAGGIGNFRLFKDEKELTDLLSNAGFSKVEVRKEGRGCAIIRAEA